MAAGVPDVISAYFVLLRRDIVVHKKSKKELNNYEVSKIKTSKTATVCKISTQSFVHIRHPWCSSLKYISVASHLNLVIFCVLNLFLLGTCYGLPMDAIILVFLCNRCHETFRYLSMLCSVQRSLLLDFTSTTADMQRI